MSLLRPFSYRETTVAESAGKWRFVLTEDLRVVTPWHYPSVSFLGPDGREWMHMGSGIRTIRAGYAWNGCSPKLRLPALGWLGTPDPEATRLASCVHDAGYQFSGHRYFPLSRENEDWLFLIHMRAEKFPLARTYHAAVRACGWMFWGRSAAPGDGTLIGAI